MKWVLTPDEFSYVWQNETDLDRRPYPVNMAPAATVRTETDHLSLRLPQRFARQADPDLAAALMLCARADATTITVSGERTAAAGDCPERILAFAAVVHQHAAILVAATSTVTVQMSHARALGELLVEVIGPARPGRAGTLREPQDAVLGATDHAGNGQTFSANGERGAARFRRALRKPVDGRGFITVTVEPDNPMSPPTRHRTWLDVSGDGRYLLTTADELTLTPVTDADFACQLLKLAQIR